MKVATWNCAMALQKKFQKLLTLDADILIIQECSQPFIEQINRSEGWSCVWFGNNLNKGLAVLVRAPWTIREAHALNPKWAGKLVIDGPTCIELFPVWACKSNSPAAEYIEQVHLLLDIIEQTSLSPFTIVVGDFNSNSKWDGDYGLNNHSAAVDRFRKLGLESAYHVFSKEPQGAERHPTLWFRKNIATDYHIDYAFLSRPLVSKLRGVEVGRCEDWLSLSDHAPVLVELDL
jgi:exonuclease III